jgi:predicted protein tyrosine phosphatase
MTQADGHDTTGDSRGGQSPPEFAVRDRFAIEHGIDTDRPCALVSVHATSTSPPRVPEAPNLVDTLQLAFDDIEPTPEMMALPGARLMTDDQARAIARFAARHLAEVELFICQCDAGVSRSAAIAAALCEAFGGDSSRFFREYEPNRYVYQKVLEAMTGRTAG